MRTRSPAKIVEPIQQLPTSRTASATSRAWTAAPTATVNMVCSALGPSRVGIAVGAVGNHERNHQFRSIVKDLATVQASFDGLRIAPVTGEIGTPLILHPVQQPRPGGTVLHPDEAHRAGVMRRGAP